MNKINFRFYVESTCESICNEPIEIVRKSLSGVSQDEKVTIKKYWKIDDYIEVNISFRVNEMSKKQFEEYFLSFSEKWEFEQVGDEFSAMWHEEIGAPINLPNVRWMLATLSN